MKKTYETPRAEKLEFDYTEITTASAPGEPNEKKKCDIPAVKNNKCGLIPRVKNNKC